MEKRLFCRFGGYKQECVSPSMQRILACTYRSCARSTQWSIICTVNKLLASLLDVRKAPSTELRLLNPHALSSHPPPFLWWLAKLSWCPTRLSSSLAVSQARESVDVCTRRGAMEAANPDQCTTVRAPLVTVRGHVRPRWRDGCGANEDGGADGGGGRHACPGALHRSWPRICSSRTWPPSGWRWSGAATWPPASDRKMEGS